MEIKRLTDTASLEQIFIDEFESLPPTGEQGAVFAVIEEGEVQAFIMAEQVVRIGLMWVKPEKRKTSASAKYLRHLFSFLFDSVPPNTSVVSLDCTGEYHRLLTKLGFRKLKGDLHRLDL
jgi:hypothetical protein